MSVKKKSLKLNFILNAILTVSTFLFPLITFPYVSRMLLPEGLGKVDFAISVATYLSMFAQLGIPTYGIRICSQESDDKIQLSRTVHELLFINTAMCILTYSVFAVALFTIPKFTEDKLLFIITATTVLFNAIGAEWLYRAIEQYKYITIRSIVFKFVALIAIFALVHSPEDYHVYSGIAIFATSASNILNFINLRKHVSMRYLGGYDIKRHIKPVLLFFAMSCATTVYTYLDTIMLGFIKDDDAVGYYTVAVKIKTILVSLITSLGTVLMPRASYFIAHNEMDKFRAIIKKAISFVMLAAVPFTVYFILFASEGITFLSGDEYRASVLPMQIVMPTLIFIGLSNISGIQMLIPMGREKSVLYSVMIGAIANLIVNCFTIPLFGATGAAIGSLTAEAVVFLVQFIMLRKELVQAYRAVRYIPLVLGTALGGTAAYFTKWINLSAIESLELTMFIRLAISAVIFFGIYFAVLLIFKEPLVWEVIGQFLGKIKGLLHKKKAN